MLSCSEREDVKCDPASDDYKRDPNALCGVDFAYPYFISFFMLCSFLVILKKKNFLFFIIGYKFICGCYYGQF